MLRYMLGGSGLRTALTEAGLTVKDDENVDYVAIGLDENVTYEKLAVATLAYVRVQDLFQRTLMYRFLKNVVSYQVMVRLQV